MTDMTRIAILAGLTEILEECAGINPSEVAEDKTFADDLDVDSLSAIEVVVAAEERFGIRIRDEDVAGLKTVGDLVTFIENAQKP